MPRHWLALCIASFALPGLCLGEGSSAIPETVEEREAAVRDAALRVARALESPVAIDVRDIASWGDLAEVIARTHRIHIQLRDFTFDNAGALSCPADKLEAGDMKLQEWVTRVLSESVTDEVGRAHFALPSAQPIAVVLAIVGGRGADCARFPSGATTFSEKLTAAELPDRVRLQVAGATTVSLRVCDERGAPWVGLPVHLSSLRKPSEKRGTLGETLSFIRSSGFVARVTDEQGMVTFDWLPHWHVGVWEFDVPYSREYVAASRMVTRAEAATGPVVMTLPRRVAITGRVTDAEGKPVADADVSAVNASHEPKSFRGNSDFIRTDGDGFYRMNVPPNRLYLLYARHSDRQLSGMKDGFVVESGKPLADLDISIHRMARVFGRVTFAPDGKPPGKTTLEGALVGRELSEVEGAVLPNPENKQDPVRPRYRFRIETDDEGRFEFLAGQGTYTLRPYGKSPQPEEVTFTVTDTSPREFNFSVEPPEDPKSRQLVGTVVAGDPPKGLEAAEVQVVSRPAHGIGLSWGHATTRADGTFEIARPKDTSWLFARSKDGRHAGMADLEPNQAEATLTLVPTATIKVRLVDTDGNPLPAGVKFEWGIRIDMGELVKGAPLSRLLYDQVVETDDQGRLTLTDMLVGVPHDVNRVTGKGRWRRAFQLTAEKGGDQVWPNDLVVPNP